MTRRLVLAMTIVAGLVALTLAIPLASIAATNVRSAFISQLEIDALSTASILSSQPESGWEATIETAAESTGARVIVVDAGRGLVADSDETALDRAFDRPEIDRALEGSLNSDVRPSQTMGAELRFVAAPVVQGMDVVAAVRFSLLEDDVDAQVARTQAWLAVFVLAVMVAAGLLAWLIARSIAGPLNRLSTVAAGLPENLGLRASESEGPAEVRSVARVLNATAERLAGILQRTERVAADASHHLRTPLTGVRLRLEAIEETTSQPDVRRQAMAATSEVDRLTRRIEQVLALARSDAKAGFIEATDASAVARDRLGHAQIIADVQGLTLLSSIDPGVTVVCSVGTFARVLDELLSNAFSYAKARIGVTLMRRIESVTLTVEDDGPGIADEERDAVFDRFARGAGSVAGGSGLGLALVREAARGAGGEAVARHSDLGGLRVEVTWPRAD
ncbi:MAG: HAMP domain-containing protein [Actinobacteria bacterium]|uniref:histidine kinase n=1 Tax=freshwater metagenome TaxID=449393 RepID=A0A6J7JB49_9ZZZZ|nr:HAMP domain-containing protein [Actinomycetota bacterium]